MAHIYYMVWMKIVCLVGCLFFSFCGPKGKKHTDTYIHTLTYTVWHRWVCLFFFCLFLLLLQTNSVNLHKISFTPCFPSFLKTNINHIQRPTKDCLCPIFCLVLFFEGNISIFVSRWSFYCSIVIIILVCCLLKHQIILRPNQSNERRHLL